MLAVVLAHTASYSFPAAAATFSENEARLVEKIKAGIASLGTGSEARVKLKMRDGRKLEGYVSEANEESFVVINAKTGVATSVAYPQVRQVKGNNFSTGAKIGIGIAIAVGVAVIIAFATRGSRDNSGQIRCGSIIAPCP